MKSSQALRSEQAFFSIRLAAPSMTELTARAPCEHTATQRMQEMHAFLSTLYGSCALIACTGQPAAQAPQATQA